MIEEFDVKHLISKGGDAKNRPFGPERSEFGLEIY